MDDFDALSKNARERIDRAFDRASSSVKSLRSEAPSVPVGGFIVDDTPAPGGFLIDDAPGGFLPPSPPAGGFMPPSPPSGGFLPPPSVGARRERSLEDVITLSEIAHALQILDLPPDDEEILSVFRNAATGWGARSRGGEEEEPEETVTRKDWRAVCSALLGGGSDEEEGDEDVEIQEPQESTGVVDDEDVPMDVIESEGDASSDEYVEEAPKPKRKRGAATKASTRKTRKKKADLADSDSEDDPMNRPLTARQQRECLHAFSLFFPGIEADAVKRRRIGIKELTQASDILKEKTNVEEMLEMLEAFSSTPDKTMGLADFEKMMATTRMV